MPEKLTGYILLITGVATILLSGLNIYQVFTRKAAPIQSFNLTSINLDLSSILPSVPGQTTSKKSTELLSSDVLNDVSNLTAHYLLVSFIASLGFKIASLGNQLLRPIEVKLKASSSEVATPRASA